MYVLRLHVYAVLYRVNWKKVSRVCGIYSTVFII
jgi:hypothetical protein